MNNSIYITRKSYNRLSFWQRVSLWLAAGASNSPVHIANVEIKKPKRRVTR